MLLRGRFYVFAFIFAIGAGTMVPRYSQAGILSALVKFFTAGSGQIEERLPSFIAESKATTGSASVLEAFGVPGGEGSDSPPAMLQDDAIVAPLNPLGMLAERDAPPGGQIFVYTIRSGDTASSIATSFDVSVNTILWANFLPDVRAIKPGTQIIILPVTGVRHEVKKGDTVAGLARQYRASIEDIIQFNRLAVDEEPRPGSTLVIPSGELQQSTPITPGEPRASSFAKLPLFEDFYIRPIEGGRRSRGIHGYNGVDLANTCGTPVAASADGTVLLARSSGWNGGYGRYLVLSHSNGTQTLYAHLKEIAASAGQTVRQGQAIGLLGSSGNSTGCHVHFEIRGARNPF